MKEVTVWHTYSAVWECNAFSPIPEVQKFLDERKTRASWGAIGLFSAVAPHDTVPNYAADSLKKSLAKSWRGMFNFYSGWSSKTSKDGFVYTRSHKATGTTITYTKVAAVWVFQPAFNSEETELANHLRNVHSYYTHCNSENIAERLNRLPVYKGWMASAIDMALCVYSEATVARVLTALEEEWSLQRTAREFGNKNDWRRREEPLTRPSPSKKKRNKI